MTTLPSVFAQNNFGKVANIAKSGEPVTITQYGEPTLMILTHRFGEEAIKAYYKLKMFDFLSSSQTKNDAPELTMEELTQMVKDARP